MAAEWTDRLALEVLALNRDGMMLKDIAVQYGFSRQRATQLRQRALEIERTPLVEYELTPRTRNALVGWGITPRPEYVAKFFKGNEGELLRVVNMGSKSIKELNEWLVRHGESEIINEQK